MTFRKVAFAALIAAGATTAPAAVISQTFTLNASGFVPVSPSSVPPPYATLSGDFTINYDPSASYVEATTLTASNFAFPFTGSLKFNYDAPTGKFTIGAGPGDPGTVAAAYPDFTFGFTNTATSNILYSSNNTIFFATSGSVRAGAAGAVPEPASWAMMVGGFGLIGGAMRRRVAVAFA